MASIRIVDLFVALEKQIGKEALCSAFAAYGSAVALPASPAAQKATVPPVPGAPVKARKPQSEETKAAAAAKRAATKAAKAAGGDAVIPPKPAGPKPATAAVPKPVAAAAPAAEDDGDITEFAPTIIKGKPYIRNSRGDVMTEEYDWVGRYNEATKTIDTKFPKPADLDE